MIIGTMYMYILKVTTHTNDLRLFSDIHNNMVLTFHPPTSKSRISYTLKKNYPHLSGQISSSVFHIVIVYYTIQ